MSTSGATAQDGIKKLRIAIGLFDQPSNLAEALEVLISKEFMVADLCVSGTIDTMSLAESMLRTRLNFAPGLMELFMNTALYQAIDGSLSVIGSQGDLHTTVNGLICQHQKNPYDRSCDECSQITSQFIAHIYDGRLILIVHADEGGQLLRASETLLMFSPYVVKTHEFLLS